MGWHHRSSVTVALAWLVVFGVVRTVPVRALQDSAIVELGQTELRDRVLATAQRYATFEWTATEANAFHGDDADGVRVDTPDTSFDERGWSIGGETNRGMPYAWGGFSSIEDFKGGLEEGLYAGLVPVSERAASSRHALGLDCSGFVARCWELPVKQSTRSLGRLCYPLDGCDDLRPGDILNKFDSHVVLFKEWVDEGRTVMRVVEAARLGVEENDYPVELLVASGFVPMRFMPLDDRWVSMETGEAEFSSDGIATPGIFTANDIAAPPEALSTHPWQDTQAGEWARYRVTDTFAAMPSAYTMLRLAADIRDGDVLAQCVVDVEGERLPSGSRMARGVSLADALVDFAAFETPLHDLELVRSELTNGQYDWGERTFSGQRHALEFAGNYVVRHQTYPLSLTVDCISSDEISLHGILQADIVMAITFEEGTYKREKVFTLDRFGLAK